MRLWTATLLLFCGTVLAQDHPYSETADIVLRWEGRSYTYRYNPSGEPIWLGNGEMLSMIRRATAGWETCGFRFHYAGTTDTAPGAMDGANVVGWRMDGRAYSGWTQWRARKNDGAIQEADITLYANIYDTYRNRGIDTRLELYKSIVHEFGHVIGLKHSDQASDAMSVRVRTKPEWHLPSSNDITRCREHYSSTDWPLPP